MLPTKPQGWVGPVGPDDLQRPLHTSAIVCFSDSVTGFGNNPNLENKMSATYKTKRNNLVVVWKRQLVGDLALDSQGGVVPMCLKTILLEDAGG